MTQQRRVLVLASICFLALFALVDVKNALKHGAPFVVDDDTWDHLKLYLSFPGVIVGFIVIVIVYQNILNYDWYALEAVTLVSSSVLYGWIISMVVRKRGGSTKSNTVFPE